MTSKVGGPPDENVYSKKPKRKLLEAGKLIPSATAKYTVVSVLGSGGFGDVYKVKKNDGEECYALKTEDAVNTESRLMRLKIEAEVLAECAKSKNDVHFLALIDRGRTEEFKFIVMPIVWLTLDRIRSDVIKTEQYSRNCATKICIQMFESLRDLHEINYLHRDLKPANFAAGLSDAKRHVVYVLDFGICRKFMDNNGNHLAPRAKVAFMGTPRYAPRSAHRQGEQSRKDDLESLCYVMVDIYHSKLIPWRGQRDRLLLLQLKDNFVEKRGPIVANLYEKLPREVERIVKYVDGLSYDQTPWYEWILQELYGTVRECREKMDWIGLDVDKARIAAREKEEKEREMIKKSSSTGSNENRTQTTPENNEKEPSDIFQAMRQAAILRTVMGRPRTKATAPAANPAPPPMSKEKAAEQLKEMVNPKEKKDLSKETVTAISSRSKENLSKEKM